MSWCGRFSHLCQKKIGFAIPRYVIGFKKLVPLCQPIRSKSKTNRYSVAHVFPRFSSAKCTSCFDWFTVLPASLVIGQSYHFSFGFTTRSITSSLSVSTLSWQFPFSHHLFSNEFIPLCHQVSPSSLIDSGLTVTRVVQKQGQFVIVFPEVRHAVVLS